MRALTYHIAISLDGFIAHTDGSWNGFLFEGDHIPDFIASFSWFDTVIMGRKTYEAGLAQGVTNPYPMLKTFVATTTMKDSPDPAVTLLNEGVVEKIGALKKEEGGDIWLCGGAQLAAPLLRAGLIDEIIVKLNPVIFGAGTPLFGAGIDLTALTLTDVKRYESGVVRLRYDVGG